MLEFLKELGYLIFLQLYLKFWFFIVLIENLCQIELPDSKFLFINWVLNLKLLKVPLHILELSNKIVFFVIEMWRMCELVVLVCKSLFVIILFFNEIFHFILNGCDEFTYWSWVPLYLSCVIGSFKHYSEKLVPFILIPIVILK